MINRVQKKLNGGQADELNQTLSKMSLTTVYTHLQEVA